MTHKVCSICCEEKPLSEFYNQNRRGRTGKRPECKDCHGDRKRKSRFGVSREQFDAMLHEQNGGCAICGGPSSGRGTFHVDHCHATGKIRGLLCNNCNAILAMANDNIERLYSAIAYLKQHA